MTTMMGVSLVLLAACCSVLSLAPHQDPHGPRFGPFPSLLPTGRAIRPLPHRLTPEEQARLHPHRLRQPHFIPSEMEPYHQHDGHATPEAAAKPSEPCKLPPRQDVPIEPFAEPRQQPETVGAAWLLPRNPQQMLPHPVYPVHQLRKREAAADLSLVPSEMDAYHQHHEGLDIGVRPVQLQHGDEEDFPFWSQPQVPRPVPVMPLPALPEQPVNPHQRSAEFAVRPAWLVPRNPQHILPHPVYPVHQLRKREAGDLSLVPSEMDAYHQHREGSQVAVRPVHLQHGDEEDFWQQSRGPHPVMPLPAFPRQDEYFHRW